jgi:dCMP deaminase
MKSLERPPRDWVLMKSAQLWMRRSTCSRAQVGAVISREGRILASGYNGAPRGMEHCDHSCGCAEVEPILPNWHYSDCTAQRPCDASVHAEVNAIAFATRYGTKIEDAELHTTRIPCRNCAGSLVNAGIKRVVWIEEHRDMTGQILLLDAGIDVVRYPV